MGDLGNFLNQGSRFLYEAGERKGKKRWDQEVYSKRIQEVKEEWERTENPFCFVCLAPSLYSRRGIQEERGWRREAWIRKKRAEKVG